MMAMLNGAQGLMGQQQIGPAAPVPQLGMGAMQRNTPPGLLGGAPMGQSSPIMPGPPAPENDPLANTGGFGMPDGIGGFFGNMDKTLQSPSKLVGLGLLNRLAPGAGLAGLLGSGFYNG